MLQPTSRQVIERPQMDSERVDISALSDEQVSSLLAMGSSKQVKDDQTPDPVDLLRQAIDAPSDAQVQLLISDLRRNVLDSESGPLSFQRLVDLSDEATQEFDGKTFAKMLMSSSTSRGALDKLARYGALMSQQVFADSTRLTGVVIRSLARMALSSRHDVELSADELANSKRVATQFARATRGAEDSSADSDHRESI
jgi:hypothetical protein